MTASLLKRTLLSCLFLYAVLLEHDNAEFIGIIAAMYFVGWMNEPARSESAAKGDGDATGG